VCGRVCPKLIDPRKAWRVVSLVTRRPVGGSRVSHQSLAVAAQEAEDACSGRGFPTAGGSDLREARFHFKC
jgi:hypothetical protein